MASPVDNPATKDLVFHDDPTINRRRLTFGGFDDASERFPCCDNMTVGDIVKYFWVQLLILPVIMFLGVWTNVAMFLTFHRKKYYSVHNFLLKTIAIVNIINLVIVVPLLFVMPFLTGLKVSALCKAASFVASLGITTVAACMVLTAINCFLNVQHALFQLSKRVVIEIVGVFFVMFCIINAAAVWVMKAREVQVFYAATGSRGARIIQMTMCLPSDNYFRYPSDIVYTFLLGMVTYTMLFLIIYFYTKAANLMAEEENLEVEIQFMDEIKKDDGSNDEGEEVLRHVNEKMIDDVTTVHFNMIIYMLFFVSMAPYYFITWRATSRTQRDLKLSSLFKVVFDIGMLLPMIFTVIQPAVQIFLTICGTDDSDTHVKELTQVSAFQD